ncbi:hypothetical protein BV20DRAFT_1039551 [Pilatotrama ljubarskyi]|nr:hypothetical protein BV20DRAFT_1039551 [Pilatotrama ljubarskyi]
MASALVTADNTDYDHFTYIPSPDSSAFWDSFSPPNDPTVYEEQLAVARAEGPSAIFHFTGSQVFVYGRVDPPKEGEQPPLTLYSVGETKNQAFIAPVVSTPTDNVSFFNSTVMPYGQYNLVINVTRASSSSPFYIDYVQYNITDPSSPPATSSKSAGVTGTSSSSSSAQVTTSAGPTGRASSVTPVGPVVGCVVGGIVVIVATVFTFLCCRSRRRRSRVPLSPMDAMDAANPSASHITPYVVPEQGESKSHLSDYPTAPYSSFMRQYGSSYSLGGTSGEYSKGALSGKTGRSPAHQPLSPSPGGSTLAGSSLSGNPSTASSALGDNHSTQPSPTTSVHDLPNFAPRACAKNVPSEAVALLDPSQGSASGLGLGLALGLGTRAQEDSGWRFEPGITPSAVAPALPQGVASIRSTATMSEVARADIPPAYTPT